MADTVMLKGFNVLLQAEDDHGLCFVAYGAAARDAEEAGRLVCGAASADGFWSIEIDEVWEPTTDAASDLGAIPEVFGRTDPTYVGDEEVSEE